MYLYKQIVDEWLAEALYSAKRILKKLREMGFDGGCSIVKAYVSSRKMDLNEKATVRFETMPGKQIQISGFPIKTTLDDFDVSFQPSIDKRRIDELATMRFLENGENMVFLGPPGVGKTNAAHVGICESWEGSYITTIDGNTGNKANGGAVMRRKRSKKYTNVVKR